LKLGLATKAWCKYQSWFKGNIKSLTEQGEGQSCLGRMNAQGAMRNFPLVVYGYENITIKGTSIHHEKS